MVPSRGVLASLVSIAVALSQAPFAAAQSFSAAARPADAPSASSQPEPPLAERIRRVTERPEFIHSHFGIEFYSLDDSSVVFAQDAGKLFVPASTTKLLTEGTALQLLGPEFRFHTRVYRAGALAPDGTLTGDLVLVAGGDPNLSGRIQPDGTLAFENHDHSYGGSPDTRAVPGDPLAVIQELANQIARRGVKRIRGRVLVDISLYPEVEHEGGTDVVISPIIVNDNVVDVTLGPGAAEGAPASLRVSPATFYVTFLNQVTTGASGSRMQINLPSDLANPDGTHVATITGSIPRDNPPILFAYPVPQPSLFAQIALSESLARAGVALETPASAPPPDFKALAASYTDENLMAQHISPPLSEEIKVTLKVSQNLHASSTPYILAALLAHNSDKQAGFDLEHEFLAGAGLDLSGAAQSDGAGADAFFTPDFMVRYLAFMSRQKNFPVFYAALPVLGRDGTLWNIQIDSPAAGHVRAKTGTFTAYNALNKNVIVTGKGLAGYLTTKDGRHLAFALYVNGVPVSREDPEAVTKIVGQALGEIAAAAYDSPR